MEKSLDIKFLEFLEPKEGVVKGINVTTFMMDNFKIPNNEDLNNDNSNEDAILFLNRLYAKKHIIFDPHRITELVKWRYPSGENNYKHWFNTITPELNVKISEQGLEYLYNYRTNYILLETNISIRDTNIAVKKNITAQLIFGIVSVIAIVTTAVIAVMAYYKDDSENLILIRKSMQRQDSILQSIQQSQKGIDTSLKIMAKKTLPKKK
jgi:hypothetical protein